MSEGVSRRSPRTCGDEPSTVPSVLSTCAKSSPAPVTARDEVSSLARARSELSIVWLRSERKIP